VVNEKLDKIQDDFSIIQNSAFTKVVMKGTENAPESRASVYWNAESKEVYLSIQNLKQISQSNQFQLWAIVDGKPVDAGVFDFNVNGLLKMKSISGASAFAITIEPRGGQTSPTMETMQVIGSLPRS
jgi:anti-sigma-K factor RskA